MYSLTLISSQMASKNRYQKAPPSFLKSQTEESADVKYSLDTADKPPPNKAGYELDRLLADHFISSTISWKESCRYESFIYCNAFLPF